MATGDDLSEEANPRSRGRAHKNQDIVEPGVWIRHPETGVVHLVNHQYQVKRLLLEGGRVVEQPHSTYDQAVQTTAQADSVEALKAEIARLSAMLNKQEGVTTNASEEHDGADHSPNKADDRGPGGSESAIPGPGHSRHLRPVKG